ncbi:MAG: hypothetical protein ACREMK_12410 [Gemmatimonadota bacterium]
MKILAIGVCLGAGLACSAPISTMRSPMHLRVLELYNETEEDWIVTIDPTADQHLGAATTFTGRLRPGETKTLYLYHGFRYQVDVLKRQSEPVISQVYWFDRDMGLVFGGDSLRRVVRLAVELGEPAVTFSDSMQSLLRRSSQPIQPDTTSLRERTRQREKERRRGEGWR